MSFLFAAQRTRYRAQRRTGRQQLETASLRLDSSTTRNSTPVHLAVVESIKEAEVNALVATEEMTTLKPAGRIRRAIDHRRLAEVMRRFGRCR
jgi:D-aminopeptidase